ncbi:putative phosphatidate cytidylyltransferase NDAI_0E01340 [Naumovozyma dairenensis CBS 421]|uniref:Phosphatidate cytidylyltransferase, mitochondrial n=1 Tax=Naumovozyma dairenensis (strain ATCC 10597 / BCRC 20456 / CBS 421 / NBRC 0211 / NRRL Y-12639) TaxID=1071378 RepID=G0WB30_NAUDC|nr:hypothetical protein NDAI_0E01340 [Naumovozyma dairenensis CBS 421]CCD24950.1 hypothetical protein NDAI_0E01340 [Naumovozyma dairenensis CBS 421]
MFASQLRPCTSSIAISRKLARRLQSTIAKDNVHASTKHSQMDTIIHDIVPTRDSTHQNPSEDILDSTVNNNSTGIPLLEKGIQKTDEITSKFQDYMYKFNKLPANYAANQILELEDQELQFELESILNQFNAPIKYAFGYGSGVFEQTGYNIKEKPQIDMIFGVTHPSHFHSLNMRQNPDHYSTLKYFGSEFIAKFQDIGAGIYFNPFVKINGHEVKYGIVSMKMLLKDLATWNTFYLAGRLQKPVKILKNDLRVQYWNQLNLKAAATIAKHLTLQKNNGKFDEFEFYKEITGISYLGDIRYVLGAENPNKVQNIVDKNFTRFQSYYEPIYKDVVINNSSYLPVGFTINNTTRKLRGRISRSSILQTLKGILTAGPAKSLRYAWAKKMKTFRK